MSETESSPVPPARPRGEASQPSLKRIPDLDLAGCLIRDRAELVPRLRGLRRRERNGQPVDRGLARWLSSGVPASP